MGRYLLRFTVVYVKLWPHFLVALVVMGALSMWVYYGGAHPGGKASGLLDKITWQRMANPGPLTGGHAFLEHDCAACHTPVKGVEANNCIVCHANNKALLGTQSTAFHADIGSCSSCHVEHLGNNQRPIKMDHKVLAKIGRQRLPPKEHERIGNLAAPHKGISVLETPLDCANCHSNEEPHRNLFGADCVICHSTAAWTVPEFQHPAATSTECAQCHQAPPSHYMEHFKMVSMKVSGVMHADVSQCFLCHKTNSWNDIKNVGWYKHH